MGQWHPLAMNPVGMCRSIAPLKEDRSVFLGYSKDATIEPGKPKRGANKILERHGTAPEQYRVKHTPGRCRVQSG